MTAEPKPATPSTSGIVGAVVLVTVIGALVRIVPVAMADFPLNDGGLFVQMTRDLIDNGFALPLETTYNAAGIPFVYPPLGFYLVGLLAALTGVDVITLFRFVPLIVAIAAIPAMFYLALGLMPTRFGAVVATIAFALIPRSFEFTISGGGLTRGLGVLFTILLLAVAIRIAKQPTVRRTVALGVLAGLAALSHPEAVVVGGVWLLVVLVTAKDRITVLKSFLAAAAIAVLVMLPWLIAVVVNHGVGPLVGAGGSGFDLRTSSIYLVGLDLTDEALLTLIGVLALVGLLVRSVGRDWRWLLWIGGVLLVDPRGGPNYLAALFGPLAAFAVVDAVLPALRWNPPADDVAWPGPSIGNGPRLALAVLLAVAIAGAIGARNGSQSPLFALSPDVRGAIAEVAEQTPAGAEVIVVSGTGWWVDATAEWFPVLAGRESVATVQGREWMGPDTWRRALEAHLTLQACAFHSVDCFERWRRANAATASFVFIPRGAPTGSPLDSECCPALRAPLVAAGYREVFDLPGGTLLQVPG